MQAPQPRGVQGSASALPLHMSLALAWVLLDPVRSQQCPPGNPLLVHQFMEIGADQRVPAQHRVPSSLDPLYGVVRRYLDVVQQNPFPTGPCLLPQVVRYQAGYVVCAMIAVLFFVAVPATGLCFCCCRCRRRCGGRIKADRRSLTCQRNLLTFCLSLTTAILLAGVICAFIANQRVKEQMEPGARAVPATLHTLRKNIGSIPQVSRSCLPCWLSAHGARRENNSCAGISGYLQNSLNHLQILNKTVRTLTHFQDELSLALRDRKESAVSLLDSPRCTSCARALGKAQSLELGADYSRVPSVEQVLKTLSGLPKANFPDLIDQVSAGFPLRPPYVSHSHLADLKDEVNKISEKVQSIADSFPVSDYTQPLNDALMQAENKSRPYLQEVKHYEKYRWIVGIVLCSVVLLVVACNLLGLSLGACGLAMREDPSDYESRGEAGAKFLLVGVGFSFLFSWLLILLVFATFLVGGNVQTLVCKNWANQEIYKVGPCFLGVPSLASCAVSSPDGRTSSGWAVLTRQSCLPGPAPVGLVVMALPCTQYTRDFQKRLDNFNLHFEEIHFLDGAGRRDLETFRQSGIDQLDYPTFQAEVRGAGAGGRPLHLHPPQQSWLPLSHLRPAQHLPRPALRRTQPRECSRAGQQRQRSADRVAEHNWVCDCVSLHPGHCLDNSLSPLLLQLTEDVASCQPLATALDNGRVILCDRIAEPWNAFWFSLGCCTFFLIPSIIFAIKLTKHFRPIRNRLISTASEETYPFHIPRVTALKL
uniref:Prominin 2 n=1 Tax=Chrysemys picta bellii TaxID=8478 RepID=A0A8C3FBD5_CHRPI